MTLVCVPLVGRTVEEMEADAAAAAASGGDLVEIRLDFIEGFRPREHLPRLLRGCPLPALVTYRPNWEGGQYEGDDTTRFETLRLAMELGVDYVDIELKVADKFISFLSGNKPEKCKLIVSSHNYEYTPSCEELANLVARIQAVGADIVKVATTAKDIVDVSRMFQVMVHCQVPMIGLVMSERGLMSRVLAPKFGGYLTFGILNATKTSASGQPTVEELLDIYNIKCIGPDTKVFGLIANPVKQSKSPILHNKCLQSVGYNAVYLPLLGDNLASFLETYSSPDFSGFSCSLPFKVDAVQCCDEHDPVAKSIGAINTIIRRPDGKLVGYNTDYIGAISAIEDGIGPGSKDAAISPLAGRLIVVVGAGGAGKAIAYGAKEKGARVVVANRTYEKAVSLANAVGGHALRLADLETFRPEEGMVLANATSLGMYPNVDGTPIPKKALSFYDVVFDAVYAPKVTRLLREAEECGVKVVSGVEMFVRQAMGQFEHFTGGIEAPESLMREIAAKYT
ncbi:bifunctional 3-dehydroquinate dehydratase/shikimate dehydrogenase, chloroplastic-like isoform X1 [Phragmites australis]|uniref:bifunctional 3-dehydroquinate dehydratase/shikimate dehydrogenase, chloroplastic-like isoform X1 n=1 Tax=Phragmites australis TaxID=29695 RepID=UPI002D79B305|nr:bifunctional 3-dehydroquinate dehydratase/shikimate dehydrogenase, chloroplastic-like isoform X1 [Phragmites australis]